MHHCRTSARYCSLYEGPVCPYLQRTQCHYSVQMPLLHCLLQGKVYALEIQPSQKPIELDGICYQRQGSSTWPLLGDDLEMFKNRREDEVNRLLKKG